MIAIPEPQHNAADYKKWKFPGGYSPFVTRGKCVYDEDAARRAIGFFPKFLVHIKGKLAGKPLKLEKWQAAIIATLFGWKRADGTRRYRMAYIEIPRKNGKSTLSAGIALLFLYMDDEPGAEIYSAASDMDQAAIVFELAKENVLRHPSMKNRSKVYQSAIVSYKGSTPRAAYRVLSSDAKTKHGYNPSVIVADELHAHPNRELWDVLNTGTGSRTEPLTVAITTAGYDRHSICYEQHDYAGKVRDGIIEDASFLPVIYAAAVDDDWKNPDVWKKANPNIDVSVSREFLAAECKKAQESPAYENTFRRLYLDQWTEQDVRWLSMDVWDEGSKSIDLAALAGRTCYAGLDLSTTTDITALSLVFPMDDGTIQVLPFMWVPGESSEKRGRRDRVPYPAWIKQGFVYGTDGNSVDYEAIRAKINELYELYDIQQIGIDRWNASQLTTQLQGDGLNVVAFGQGFASMSGPTKEFETLILSRKLIHGGHPVLRWMASNVSVETDAAGNIKPSKSKSTERIDGIVATIMAVGICSVSEGTEPTGEVFAL